jgi:aspartyl protease family protein
MRHIVLLALVVIAAAVLAGRIADSTVPTPRPAQSAAAQTQAVVPAGGRTVSVPGDGHGHFKVQARVDGRTIEFLVDTGASMIALRESEAARLGIRPQARDYTIRVSTANGVTRGAPVTLGRVDVEGVVVRDVPAVVQPDDALPVNLLGMAYLSRVRFSHERGRLVIEQ